VDADEYAELRARAGSEPWRSVALEALRYADEESFDPRASAFQAKTRLTDLCGALALAHVLDPRPNRVEKLREVLGQWPDYFEPTAPQGSVTQVRWQQGAMVQSILALDVMHAALEPDELAGLEAMIDGMVGAWWDNLAQDGTTSTPGLTAIWALYEGDRERFRAARDLFLERFWAELTPGGIFDGGVGYAWVRQGGDRLSKYALLDVLQHTGEDDSLYSDARLVGLHEWLYGGAYTPRRTNLTFGDSDPSRVLEGLQGYMPGYRAGLLSERAGRHAAWLLRDVEPRPLLSNYVLLNTTLLAPEPPRSALYADAASFYEDGGSEDSLMGALWSPRSSGGHSHKDVNSVHLYAYGENVLRNVGFCGAGEGVDGTFDWEWVFDTAASSNTLTLGEADHAGKVGAGILEGLVAPGFDYAAAGSGPALAGGSHVRSLLFVHGESVRPGYFVLLDEVVAAAGQAVCLDLHPDAAGLSTLAAGTEYGASVRQLGPSAVGLALFLGTSPARVELRPGGLCAFDGNEYVGQFLHACHAADAAGQARTVTLLVPHDGDHSKPALARLSAAGATGASVGYPDGTLDIVAESSGEALVVLGPQAFRGHGLHLRTSGGLLRQYFVRRGRALDDGAPARRGFESDAELSLFVRGTESYVTSAGATVTFHEPALTGASFTSAAGTVLSAGPGFVRVRLNPGRFGFDLASGARLP
jgi:hypothetical protein